MASHIDLNNQNMTGSSQVPEAQLQDEHDSAVAYINKDLAAPLLQNNTN